MSTPDGRSGGIVTSLKKLGASCLEALYTRADLISIELQEEKSRLLTALVLAISGTFLSIITLVMITLTIIASVPEEWTILVSILFCLLYLGASAFCFWKLKSMLQDGPKPFHETINQLKKDQQCLKR
jgi:uncharacterized membrane protein YqjE